MRLADTFLAHPSPSSGPALQPNFWRDRRTHKMFPPQPTKPSSQVARSSHYAKHPSTSTPRIQLSLSLSIAMPDFCGQCLGMGLCEATSTHEFWGMLLGRGGIHED